MWNDVQCGGIHFSVSDSFVTATHGHDEFSVISFEEWTADAQVLLMDWYGKLEYDIIFDRDKPWPVSTGFSYKRTIAHELGHCAGLGDMGYDCHPYHNDPLDFAENLMWHDGDDGIDLSIDSPQMGDMQGVVYCATDMSSGTMSSYDKIALRYAYLNNGLTIPAGDEVYIVDDGEIMVDPGEKINVYGTLELNDNTSITGVGSFGHGFGGIDLESGGSIDVKGNSFISFANSGIRMYDPDGLNVDNGYTLTISFCSDYGIYQACANPEISRVIFYGCGTLFNEGALYLNRSSGATQIDNVTLGYPYGTYIQTGINIMAGQVVDLSYVDIFSDLDEHSIRIDTWSNLVVENSNIRRNSGANKKAIYLTTSTDTIMAQGNYWGTPTPTDDLFNYPGRVDYTNYETTAIGAAGAPKVLVEPVKQSDLNIARNYEKAGNWDDAINMYHSIMTHSNNCAELKHSIHRLIKAHSKSDKDFSDVRHFIESRRNIFEANYQPVMDATLCEILVQENRLQEAIEAYKSVVEKYAGTSFEVEMLARVAEIYGARLYDKGNAILYADKAAAINPGQTVLLGAYGSADIDYDPSQYVDKFAGLEEDFSDFLIHPKTHNVESIEQSVTFSPNPFNPSTVFNYSLSETGPVTLDVYSITGQKVATLVDDILDIGSYSTVFDGSDLGSGMYFYRFNASDYTQTGKMLLIK